MIITFTKDSQQDLKLSWVPKWVPEENDWLIVDAIDWLCAVGME